MLAILGEGKASISLSEMDEWTGANQILDDLGVATRILVVNGAYDREIINRYIRSSQSVNATHIAITHFDEMTNSTKLWPIILNSNLAPVCICILWTRRIDSIDHATLHFARGDAGRKGQSPLHCTHLASEIRIRCSCVLS